MEMPLTGLIGIRAAELAHLHADPADRIIVATVLEGHSLVTADDRILQWSGQLSRLDAQDLTLSPQVPKGKWTEDRPPVGGHRFILWLDQGSTPLPRVIIPSHHANR